VARVLLHTVEDPRRCSYLPEETAALELKLLVDIGPQEYEDMMARGWRRFGFAYFRPACTACAACVSLRVPVASFAPSRSQRRAAKKGLALRCEVGPVRVDAARLALYAAWHAGREDARGWEPMPLTQQDYARDFAVPHPCARELAYYDDSAASGPGPGPRLVGVGLCDVTPHAWSAIYFYYDPAYASLSPGVVHVLTLIELARRLGQEHVYLGYRVSQCPSMRYKAQFRPHQLLEGRPAPEESPVWR
jgi:arginyl-tRNA--protein-N-Asp/Glu arginylyltransferase